MNIGVGARLQINGGSFAVETHGSPTATLRKFVIDALQSGANLSKVGKVVLVDTQGFERDYTTSLNISMPPSNQPQNNFTISCSISSTAEYDIARVRIYDVNGNMYFDITLSSPQRITSGSSVSITITITITTDVSLTGELSGGSPVDYLRQLVRDVLAGVTDPVYTTTVTVDKLKISDVSMSVASGTVSSGTLSITRVDDYTLNVYKDFTATSDVIVSGVSILSSFAYPISGNNVPHISVSISKSYSANTRLSVAFSIRT